MNGWVIVDEEDFPMAYIEEDDLLIRSRSTATVFPTETDAEVVADGYEGVRVVPIELTVPEVGRLKVCWDCKGVGHSADECAIMRWVN